MPSKSKSRDRSKSERAKALERQKKNEEKKQRLLQGEIRCKGGCNTVLSKYNYEEYCSPCIRAKTKIDAEFRLKHRRLDTRL